MVLCYIKCGGLDSKVWPLDYPTSITSKKNVGSEWFQPRPSEIRGATQCAALHLPADLTHPEMCAHCCAGAVGSVFLTSVSVAPPDEVSKRNTQTLLPSSCGWTHTHHQATRDYVIIADIETCFIVYYVCRIIYTLCIILTFYKTFSKYAILQGENKTCLPNS